MPLGSDSDFEARAWPELRALLAAVDQTGEEVEAELASDRLTFEFPDGSEGVLNTQRAARQLWLAMDRNSWHFDWEQESGGWISKKTGEELWSTLERLLSKKLGRAVKLSQPSQ